MKRLAICLLCVILLIPCFTALQEEEKVLNLFTWEYYVDDDTLADFEAATGIKVNYTVFSENEEMLLKLQAVGGGDYDIIIASDYILNIARKEGLLGKIDTSRLTNYANIDPAFLSQYYDEANEYTVPYCAGTPLIVYNPDEVDIEITGYEDLWNPALKDSIVILNEARNMLGITLKTLGHSFNITDDAILAEAKAKLMELRPNVRAFNSETAYIDLLSGECSVAYMYTPYVVMALEENPDLQVVYAKEGLGFGIDALVIPVNAPHPDNAHLFIDFVLDAEIAAQVAVAQYAVCPISAAMEYMPEELKNNPALYIPSDILVNPEFIKDVGEYESVYQSIWSDFKLAR